MEHSTSRANRLPVGGLALVVVTALIVAAVWSGHLPRGDGSPGAGYETAGGDQQSFEPHVVHNPPLLALPGEPVELQFDRICPAALPEDDPCLDEGSVYLRRHGDRDYTEVALRDGGAERGGRLYARVPESFLTGSGFSYYAHLGEDGRVVVPAAGVDAPHDTWILEDPSVVELTLEAFRSPRPPDATPVRADWGSGADELGYDPAHEGIGTGPSSFDVAEDGTVVVMDPVNRRLVYVEPGGSRRLVPVQITSALPDIALGEEGIVFVLESSAPDGGNPYVKAFNAAGDLVVSNRIAEPIPSRVRMEPTGPRVYQYPSAMWMPVVDEAGRTLSPSAQVLDELPGLLEETGTAATTEPVAQTIAKYTPEGLRFAVVGPSGVEASWIVQAPASGDDLDFGEIQLAQQVDGGLVAVAALFTDSASEFRAFRLTEAGLAEEFRVASGIHTETASVSRFRLGPDGDLYQFRSSPVEAEIVRFNLQGGSS